ncbi:MAG: hypothetical protein H6Q72_957 [Firmicutes bacterium]|nr:hypothetical protein [Bacillota bacterium]
MTDQMTAAQGNTNAVESAFDLQLFAEGDPAPDPVTDPAPSDPNPTPDPTTEPVNNPDPTTGNPADPKPDLLADYKPTLPEGFTADEAIMGEFLPLAKELGISGEQADKLIGVGAHLAERVIADINQQCESKYGEAINAIKAEQGSDFEKNVGQVNALLTKYGDKNTPEAFQAAMTALAGYAPDAVKPLYDALIKIGKDAADPSFHMGSSAPSGPKSLGDVLYGKSK